jgi:hypothetical protein
MKGCIAMARYENEFSRGNPMAWGEGNGHRGQPAYGQYGAPGEYGWGSEGPGEYGAQGYRAMGDYPGRGFVGPGPEWRDYGDQPYSRQGVARQGFAAQQGFPSTYGMGRSTGWQQQAFAGPDIGEEGQFGPWRGSGYGGYGPTSRAITEGYGPQGFGAYGKGWRPEMMRGVAGQEWFARGGPSGYWNQGTAEPGYFPGEQRAWEQRQVGGWGEIPFGEPGYVGPARELTGPMGMFRESIAPGPFTGRGPRGYQRSDARIEEDVNERLTRHPLLDASDVEVRVRGGEVTLTGMVDNRQAKRLAEDIIETISGVKDVNNQLRVQLDRGMVGEEATGATRGQQAAARGQTPRTPATKTPATTAA